MGFTQSISGIMIFLTGLLPASCRKSPPVEKASVPIVAAVTNKVVTTPPNIRNLGEIILTNHMDSYVRLSSGEDCLFSPKVLDRQNVQIAVSIESRNEYGETRNFAVSQIVVQSGKPTQVNLGELKLNFTALISTNE
jgi:hypothetical protein